jgi:hypothetical protein
MSSSILFSNPLPVVWEAFQATTDGLRMAERAMRPLRAENVDCQRELCFYQQRLLKRLLFDTHSNVALLLQRSEEESQDLFILGLWATFERFLRTYLQHKGEALKQHVQPSALADSLYQHFHKEAEYWKPVEILDFLKDSLFPTEEGRNLIGLAKQILEYRDWVAHGKNPNRLPSAKNLKPKVAYETLSKIVNTLLRHYP